MCFLSFVADVTGVSKFLFTAPLVPNVIEADRNLFQSLGVPLFMWQAEKVQPKRKWSKHPLHPAKHKKPLSFPLIKLKCFGSSCLQFFCNNRGPPCWRLGCLLWFDSANYNLISRSSH